MDVEHVPVLLRQTVELLAPRRGGLFVDCTVGLGGHAAAILQASPDVQLLGIDRDPHALARARRRLEPFGDRVELLPGNFADLPALLGERRPAGILADLGLSSLQLETAERGFSFARRGPLDMRMDSDRPGGAQVTAADIVNHYSEAELERIFRQLGEERQARRIARAVVATRQEKPLATTAELADVIRRAKGAPPGRREGRVDPATRVFQALRIEVNRELDALERFIEEAVRLLALDGRLVVISYHSLEDRIVKHALRALSRGEVDEITGRPRAETRLIEVLTKKPVRPDEAEVAANPRARSARLRAARRLENR